MRQLEQKQEELNLKTAEIQRLISNPQTSMWKAKLAFLT